MSTVLLHCPDIASASCVKNLIDILFSSATDSPDLTQSKQGMVLVAHSPLSFIQDQDYQALLDVPASFLHSFNVMSCIYYSYELEDDSHILKHQAAECAEFPNCRFLDEFLLSLTQVSLHIEFNTTNGCAFQLEPSLGQPNEKQR